MKITYIEKRFHSSTLTLIGLANEIIGEYQAKGLRLAQRQLYYQFVVRNWIPNKESHRKRLGKAISDARLAGLVDWDAIVDRSRNVIAPATWASPNDILDTCASQYQIDMWAKQDHRVEVWIEKSALMGVISGVCERLRVPYFACVGYTSTSELWAAGHNRIRGYLDQDQNPIILHLGDHDPSGLDMTRDIYERLSMFARQPINVERIALNMDQVEQHHLPPNPAKEKDSRYAGYASEFGDESWEVDALSTEVLVALIEENVARFRSDDQWAKDLEEERSQRGAIQELSECYGDVQEYLRSRGA